MIPDGRSMLNAPNPSPVLIHFCSPWIPTSRGGVVACKSKDLNTPATGDPRYVTCEACFALMSEHQREIRAEQVRRYGT